MKGNKNMRRDSLSAKEFAEIIKSYEKLNNNNYADQIIISGIKDWRQVYQKGNDEKYGRIVVCDRLRVRRELTFDEFYGGGIVD